MNHTLVLLATPKVGTGKTTLARYIVEALNIPENQVANIAYTGKASLVLKDKGLHNCMTAHKLLYHVKELSDGSYEFKPRKALERDFKLIIIDEVSMLPEDMWQLLLSHGIYIIALGDPEQLPPIDGISTILDKPHVFLNEIVRQALDNPIIKLSMEIRNGNKLHYTTSDKRCRILPRSKVSDKMLIGADQIICGKNKTRNELNYYMRKLILRDKYSDDPVEGDKVICLKNSWDNINNLGNELVNGTIGTLRNVCVLETPPYGKVLYADFISSDGGIYKHLTIDYQLITTGKPTINSENWKKFVGHSKLLQFAFGYVITCHKAEGSQYNKVIVFDEAFGDVDMRRRWRYTACTRAAEQLVLVV